MKRKASGAQCVPEAILSAKSEVPGPLKCRGNLQNIEVFARGHLRHSGTQKSGFGLPKVTLWGTFLAPFGHLGTTLVTLWPQSADTKLVPSAVCISSKKTQKSSPPKRHVGRMALDCGDQVKLTFPARIAINTREYCNSAAWRKQGPLGKGDY